MNSLVPDLRVCTVLQEGLPPGIATNVGACLAAGLAAALPGWAGQGLKDAGGWTTWASSALPIAVLRADAAGLRRLATQLQDIPAEARVVLFPAYARQMHDAQAYWQVHAQRSHVQEDLLGIGLVGPRPWVKRLTGALPLWR
ncbi:MAG TPA: DUF2000 family protein [Burkholderiaceae bacterium]|nr:DUF2000 family protein [Burkholderiaceae bacterium]